jgi:hypothetical protein
MADRKPIDSWLTDMDGVLIHEGVPIPGADAFLKKLRDSGRPFLVLTNNSIYTPRDLHARLRRMGLDVPGRTSGPPRWPPPSSSPTSGPAAARTSSARPG